MGTKEKYIYPLLNPLMKVLDPFHRQMCPGTVAMFHLGRVGSTVVSDLLNQHPKIDWSGEIYAEDVFKQPPCNQEALCRLSNQDIVTHLKKRKRYALNRFYGFEAKPIQIELNNYHLDRYIECVESLGNTYFILLDRKNKLRKLLSGLIAHRSSKFHQAAGKAPKLETIRVPLSSFDLGTESKTLIEFLDDYENQISSLKSLLKSKKLLTLTYEEDVLDNPKLAYDKICQFLGLDTYQPRITLGRTNPFPVKQIIENFDEIKTLLQGTSYQWMLHDE